MDKDILRELAELKRINPERHRERLLELTMALQKKIELGESLNKIETVIYEAGGRIKKELKEKAKRELILREKIRRRVGGAAARERFEERVPYEEKKAGIEEWLTPHVYYYKDELGEAQERIAKERFGIPFAELSDDAAREVWKEIVREGTAWFRFPDFESMLWGQFGFAMYKPSPTNYWWLWQNDPDGFEHVKGWRSMPACLLYKWLKVEGRLTYGEITRATGIPSHVIDVYMDECAAARKARGLAVET